MKCINEVNDKIFDTRKYIVRKSTYFKNLDNNFYGLTQKS